MAPELTLNDLVRGLNRFGEHYKALDVLTSSVKELVIAEQTCQLGELRQIDDRTFAFERDGTTYQLKLHDSGIARLTQAATNLLGLSKEQVAWGALGAALGGAATKELPGALLGFLVGAVLGDSPESPRRVLSVRYDPTAREWRAYDGPLSKWIREESIKARLGQI